MRAPKPTGFVLATVLVLLALSALIVADALATASTSMALATRLRLREQAFQVAEAGLAAAHSALRNERTPASIAVSGDGGSNAVVSSRVDAVEPLPAGFSAGRFAIEKLTVESQARGPKHTRLTIAAGYSRWVARP